MYRFKNDMPLEQTANVHIETKDVRGELQATLTIDVATEQDPGTIKVVAKNPAGEANTVGNLKVKSKYTYLHLLIRYLPIC